MIYIYKTKYIIFLKYIIYQKFIRIFYIYIYNIYIYLNYIITKINIYMYHENSFILFYLIYQKNI